MVLHGNPLTVVVAESDSDLKKIIAYALRPYSEDIYFACDGYETLIALDEIAPALVILDLNLPKLSGAKLLEYLVVRLEQSDLCAVLTSSYAGREILGQLPPACTLVQKPYDLSQLRDAIDEQLARV